ncbi:phosphoesterase RecJ domain-containing protein [Spirosomataceae bacterium TFI 002]|nr:phosphoesterase RecJ domain-containing protein [Spirosomataceae bacterium TFI 002]
MEFFSTPKDIVITSHQNPDGDAYGSSFGLQSVLTNLGHNAVVISPTDHAAYIGWLPGVEGVINFEGKDQPKAIKLIQKADAIFCLDFSALNRIKEMEVHIRVSRAVKVLVDHHQEPEDFADYVFWNEKAAATCELLYLMCEELGWEDKIDKDAAICLYTGILTDTGSFKFDATTADIHRIAGKLIEKGIRPSKIHRTLFDNQSVDRLKFLGFALNERLHYLPEYRLAYFKFSQADLKQFNSQKGDTEGIVNYGLGIEGVIFSAIFVEMEDMVKMSFRSVDDFSVSEFARENFNGGGHKNAAGGRSFETLDAVEKKFLNLLPIYKEQLLAQPA